MNWLDLLGWAGSALLIYSIMQARVLRFRVLNLIACLVLVVFNGLLGVGDWSGDGHSDVLARTTDGSLRLVALTDSCATRRFAICFRDEARLSPSARLLLAHLQRVAA